MRRKKATWIKLYRGIMNSAVWDDNMRFKAWVYILLETNYADKMTYDHGRAIKVKRGQCLTSIRKIGKMVGCEPKTAKRILEQFQEDNMITFEIVPGQYTLITVLKYRDFQAEEPPHDYTDDLTDDTTDDYTDNLTEDYTDDTTDDLTDDLQHKKYKNIKKGLKKKNDSPSPAGAGSAIVRKVDGGGDMPDGWTQKLEDLFAETYEKNSETYPGFCRQILYDVGGWDEEE